MLLKVKDLKKSYKEKLVVKGISFEVAEGEVIGVLGPNGAGKSTTINMICTLLNQDNGKVIFKEKSVNDKDINYKKSIGLVPQEISLFLELSAYENVKFFCSLYGFKGNKLEENTMEALEYVGLLEKKDEIASSFSGGMKRRLNIACSIAHKPELLIMDEPTVGIDPQSRNNILEVIKRLQGEGTSVIYTSHYMEEVQAICSRLIIIDEGKIIEEGNTMEIIKKYNSEKLEEVFLKITGKELRD